MTLNLSTLYGSVGPTNTNIADAVAADSNMAATISANVPSASTIATAVAGAVTSGFGNNYTLLTSTAYNGSTSYTLSWSGTYKKIVVVMQNGALGAAGLMIMQINNDTTKNYSSGSWNQSSNSAASSSAAYIDYWNTTGSLQIVFENPNQTNGPKWWSGVGSNGDFFSGSYGGSSAITSVTLATNGGSAINSNGLVGYNGIYVYGVN